jgi:hypothetical protein
MAYPSRGASAFAVICLLFTVTSARSAGAQTTAVYFDSEPGDFIGLGVQQVWTPTTVGIIASASADRSRVTISLRAADVTTFWDLSFAGAEGGPIMPGVYENAIRYPFQRSFAYGLDVSGAGRGCNTLIGRFVVYEAVITSTGTVTRFAADFEQHCEGFTPALFGAVRFNSTRSSLTPFDGGYPVYSLHLEPAVNGYVTGPGIDCGAGRTDCDQTYDADAVVALQTFASPGYVFLGWAGLDCVGDQNPALVITRRKFCIPVFNLAPGGTGTESPDYSHGAFFLDGTLGTSEGQALAGRVRQAYLDLAAQPLTSALSTRFTSAAYVEFAIEGPRRASWTIAFGSPTGELLTPGTYEYTDDSLLGGPLPFLRLSGNAGFCTGGGRFVIYEIAFAGGVLTGFAADFELPCGNSGDLTAGSIRYRSTRASLLPFAGAYPLNALRVLPTTGGFVTAPDIDCGDGGRLDCDETYSIQTQVTLQAFASPGYQFIGWSGSCTSPSGVTTVLVNRGKRCFAVFSPSAASSLPADPSLGTATLLIDAPLNSPALRSILLAADSWTSIDASGGGSEVSVFFRSSTGIQSNLRFTSPNGARLAPGDYEEAYASPLPSFAGFSGASCSPTMARFRVYEASFDSAGAPLAFAADFEAFCGFSNQPYIVGAVRFNSTRGRIIPFDGAYPVYKLKVEAAVNGTVTGPGIDCGPGRADCSETYLSPITVPLTATPAPGFRFIGWTGACDGQASTTILVNWIRRCSAVFNALVPGVGPEDPRTKDAALFVDSQVGDPVGGGRRHVWLDALPDLTSNARNSVRVIFRTPEGSSWWLELQAQGTEGLRPGVYDNAVYPFTANRTGPGLWVVSPTGSCSTNLVGRFVIHEIAFQANTNNVTSLAADFEHRCTPGSAGLVGSVRYNSSRFLLRPFPPMPAVRVPGDFSLDGRVDFIWQNRANGHLAAWFLSGTVQIDNTSLGPDQVTDTAWQIVGTADANQDGHTDLYWQHQTTGALAIWYMVETIRVGTDSLVPGSVPDTAWKVRAVTDLDVDGHPDLIWQHVGNGQVAVWFMTGQRVRSGELLVPGQVSDLGWKIVGAGDVDRNGTPELFWHHSMTGHIAVWFMSGRVATSGHAISPDHVSDTAWQLRGVGDLDGNGSPDLIWQNTTTFQVAAWLLSGLRLIDGRLITGPTLPNADWYVVSPK